MIPVVFLWLTHLNLGRSNIPAPWVNHVVGDCSVAAGRPIFDLSGIEAGPMGEPDGVDDVRWHTTTSDDRVGE
ncbi:MAG: hypothetical protein R3B95_17530 [Nitrospirales bacterium]|nr:hypothetical protein [Nitrospirales bacterium]